MLLLKLGWYSKCAFKKLGYKLIFGKSVHFGKKTRFKPGFKMTNVKPGKIVIGDRCFFNNFCSLNAMNSIQIGTNCVFGEGVKVYDHNHKFNKENMSIKDQGFSVGAVKVGDNCWIGSNVVLLKGAEIGNNCVIGAGCIIDFKVKDGTIVKKVNDDYVLEDIRYV